MKNLVLYDDDFKINCLISEFTGELINGIFNSELYYIQVSDEIFTYLATESKNIIHFVKDPKTLGEILNKNDFNITVKPTSPVKPTPEQLLTQAILETQLEESKLSKQTAILGKSSFETALQNIAIQKQMLKQNKQIQVLSKAVFEMTLSK